MYVFEIKRNTQTPPFVAIVCWPFTWVVLLVYALLIWLSDRELSYTDFYNRAFDKFKQRKDTRDEQS